MVSLLFAKPGLASLAQVSRRLTGSSAVQIAVGLHFWCKFECLYKFREKLTTASEFFKTVYTVQIVEISGSFKQGCPLPKVASRTLAIVESANFFSTPNARINFFELKTRVDYYTLPGAGMG